MADAKGKYLRANETQPGPVLCKESLLGRRHGQALVEYVLVVAAIALTFLLAVAALFILLAELEGQ
jgi:hypothetical protein